MQYLTPVLWVWVVQLLVCRLLQFPPLSIAELPPGLWMASTLSTSTTKHPNPLVVLKIDCKFMCRTRPSSYGR